MVLVAFGGERLEAGAGGGLGLSLGQLLLDGAERVDCFAVALFEEGGFAFGGVGADAEAQQDSCDEGNDGDENLHGILHELFA